MNEFIKGKIQIEKFIQHHKQNFINYCEVVIYPDGDVEYCIPSHQETLIRITGISKEILWKELFYCGDVIKQLCNKTGCMSVWFNGFIAPDNITNEQLESLKKLKDAECIAY